MYLIVLVLFISCKSTSDLVQAPIDYSDVIDEAVKSQPEVKQSNLKPETKRTINVTIESLKECQLYSDQCYLKNKSLAKENSELKEKVDSLKQENSELKDELQFYRVVKWILIIGGISFVLYKLGVFQFLFALVRKIIFKV